MSNEYKLVQYSNEKKTCKKTRHISVIFGGRHVMIGILIESDGKRKLIKDNGNLNSGNYLSYNGLIFRSIWKIFQHGGSFAAHHMTKMVSYGWRCWNFEIPESTKFYIIDRIMVGTKRISTLLQARKDLWILPKSTMANSNNFPFNVPYKWDNDSSQMQWH